MISIFFVFLSPIAFRIMNSTNEFMPKEFYTAPSLRLISIHMELAFLQSNLEPIGGGDDPDIDW